ncbi:hypothetical protein [Polyangium mundeleinium]|uniref:Uncharacterized protein n=1 Tax=Polyangium mundeleinium TaxID=2995306 RepID=A0ABT5EU62_9BACT|nr:hypothetical protein [Polyangium mundeleinium]MDC0745340.1 hypothetical protein [Polyangium mundeleinium]
MNENNLPQCPSVFPDRFVFYRGTEGQVECSPCTCGEPVGAKCNAKLSAFQDPACGSVPPSLFENVPAAAICIDFSASPLTLGAMEADWISNEPGTCEPSGGELIGEVKGTDPRVFCCQTPPPPQNE